MVKQQNALYTILLLITIIIGLLLTLFYLNRINTEGFQSITSPKSYDIVVAQYNEDVSWLLPYAQHVKLYIKSGKKNASALELEKAGAKVTMLPNVGRESHTYLQYVIDNYDKLPEYVVFTQGQIEPHYNKYTFQNKLINIGNNSYSENYSSEYHPSKEDNFRLKEYDGRLEPAGMNYGEFKQKYIKRFMPPKGTHRMYWGAIFSVKRDRILSREKSEYEQMIKPLMNSSNPEIGHFFERSWYYIFS